MNLNGWICTNSISFVLQLELTWQTPELSRTSPHSLPARLSPSWKPLSALEPAVVALQFRWRQGPPRYAHIRGQGVQLLDPHQGQAGAGRSGLSCGPGCPPRLTFSCLHSILRLSTTFSCINGGRCMLGLEMEGTFLQRGFAFASRSRRIPTWNQISPFPGP